MPFDSQYSQDPLHETSASSVRLLIEWPCRYEVRCYSTCLVAGGTGIPTAWHGNMGYPFLVLGNILSRILYKDADIDVDVIVDVDATVRTYKGTDSTVLIIFSSHEKSPLTGCTVPQSYLSIQLAKKRNPVPVWDRALSIARYR